MVNCYDVDITLFFLYRIFFTRENKDGTNDIYSRLSQEVTLFFEIVLGVVNP